MPTPTGMNCSLRRSYGRPIKRRAVVSAKKLVMVIRGLNTGDWLFAEVEESLTTLESLYSSPFLQQFVKSVCQDRTQLTIDQDGNSDANVVKPVALGMKLVDAKTIHPAIKYAFASTGSNNLLSYNNGDGGSKLLNQCRRSKSFAYS